MGTTAKQPVTSVDTLAIEQAYQDRLIARRLPSWMSELSPVQFDVLSEALKTSLACQQGLDAAFTPVQGIDAFTRPLLQQALAERYKVDQAVDTLFFRQQYFYWANEGGQVAGRYPLQGTDDYETPLLEAALCNFTVQEAGSNGQPRRNAVVDAAGTALAHPGAQGFAAMCRELDLGRRYQEHLAGVLDAGAGQAANGQGIKALLTQLYQANLVIDACKAKVDGVLTEAELALVIGLYRDGQPGTLEGAPVIARQLQAFGCDLQQIVVLDVVDKGWLFDTSRRVLVYIPGDPQGPWSARDDLEDFARRVLGMRLRNVEYQRFFRRFVRRRDSQQFFTKVEERLGDVAVWATRDLDERMRAYPAALFEHLADAHIARIKDDAAMIAPPVAQLDRALQVAHDKRLAAEGWTLLGLAGLFVPQIGVALLAVMAWDLLKETFHAVEDWREGDTRAALDHVLSIGKTVVVTGVTVAGVLAVRRAWNVVDELVPARMEDGSEKLWSGDLVPFCSEAPGSEATADDQGIYRLGDQHWIRLLGHYYPVIQRASDEQWQLRPLQGHGPLLRHNGAGAWRVWSEQPSEWEDSHVMFRRLGGAFDSLDDARIDQALAIHGLEASDLRRLHVYGQAPQAELVDTVSRIVLADRIAALIGQLRAGAMIDDAPLYAKARGLSGAEQMNDQALAEHLWAQRRSLLQQLYDEQFPTTDATQLLQRDFASLHRLAAQALLREASDEDRQSLLDNRKVPLAMAQAASTRTRRIRAARALEALTLDTPQSLDLVRVVLRLLEKMPGAATSPRWQLFDADAGEPLLTTGGTGRELQLVHREGVFQLRDRNGGAIGAPGELFTVMGRGFSTEQRDMLGIGEPFASLLRGALARQALGQRQIVVEALGLDRPPTSFLAPQRLDGGRTGYPLSGWRRWFGLASNRPRALAARLRDLYPAFSDAQIQQWLEQLQQEGRDADAQLGVLEEQHALLAKTLSAWRRKAFATSEWEARGEFMQGLMDCWRFLVPELGGDTPVMGGYLLTQTGSRLKQLPSIPVQLSFPHVSSLALRVMRLRSIPDDFLRAFPNLHTLEITGCNLQRLPLSLALSERLEVLDLSSNRITLDAGQALILAGCRSLIYLNLSRNPLRRPFSVLGMPRLNALLLSRTEIADMPYGVMEAPRLHTLDLSDNSINMLPEGFHQSRLWRAGRVHLFGNLLAAPDQAVIAWNAVAGSQVPMQLRWLDLVDTELRDEMAAVWDLLEGEADSEHFFHLLGELTTSADFRGEFSARYLAARLLRMMQLMRENTELKQELFDNSVVTRCEDSATFRFSDLEVRVRVWRAEQGKLPGQREQVLLHLGGQLWRLQRLDELAWAHAEIMPTAGVESLEVALAYRIDLQGELDLPVEFDGMLHRRVANIGRADTVRARNWIVTAQTEEAISAWMVELRFWRQYLESTFAERLRVPQSDHDQLDDLLARNAPDEAIDRLQARIRQREHDTLLALTREALARSAHTWRVGLQ
ncbi:NEL-type E3 ubiquitin ligase domain-containing protein [Pseudomonas entomophila]|uniref:NEL-type E3 ubiquitin ligase domain-containing protein n=1 Tax=Pseudomonas entomophila TaxID=312306 RepID=UPI002405150B|nr:NEL-type E3 ubiquitin ligase domain-containing protein [Pseudomonas entomophila]MDF9619180.1 NEL-type E3 ubiquitin ligase domain-containing protein [Pseudomonas entomophila]